MIFIILIDTWMTSLSWTPSKTSKSLNFEDIVTQFLMLTFRIFESSRSSSYNEIKLHRLSYLSYINYNYHALIVVRKLKNEISKFWSLFSKFITSLILHLKSANARTYFMWISWANMSMFRLSEPPMRTVFERIWKWRIVCTSSRISLHL